MARQPLIKKLNEALADVEAMADEVMEGGELMRAERSALALRALVMRAELWAAMKDRNDGTIEVPDATR